MISISACYPRLPGFIVCSALLSLSITSCKEKTTTESESVTTASTPDSLPADFAAFYDRFHTDSLYQLDHINFPLEGLPHAGSDKDTLTSTRYFWDRDTWKKHNHFTDPGGQFDHWYEVLNERLIEHWVQMKGTDMVIHRRFAKLDDEWYLIYYAGLRPHTRKENN